MKQVYMYTLSTCPWCIGAQRWFKQRNIPFEYTDFDVARKTTQTKILAEMEAAGVSGFPYVRIGETVVQGYKPGRFRELLALEEPLDPPPGEGTSTPT
jgi:glutaredoxin